MNDIGVIFDCDGTLVDSMGAWHEVDRTLAAEAGITLTEADAVAITTMSLPEASAYLHEQCGLGESNEAVLEMIFDRMRAFYANEVEARPGALAFVQALHERGVPMAVASSTPADMLATCVERCGFAPYMKTVVSVDDLQTSKREPAVYDHARSFLGTDRAHTWGFEDAAYALEARLKDIGLRCKCDDSDQSNGWKYAEYEMKGVPLRVEIGPKDIEKEQCVIVRRDTGEKTFVPLAELEETVQELLKALHTNLYESAKKRLEENTYACTTVEEVKANMEKRKGFAKTMWCGNLACELAMKELAGVSSRCIPFDQEKISDVCPVCGKPAKHMVYWGVAY